MSTQDDLDGNKYRHSATYEGAKFGDDIETVSQRIARSINNLIFNPLDIKLRENPKLRATLNPAFPFPREMRIGFLRSGLAIEYVGPEKENENNFPVQFCEQPSLFAFLGIDNSQIDERPFTCDNLISNTNIYLGDSLDRLHELHYDLFNSSELTMLGGYLDIEQASGLTCLSNVSICWTTRDGELRVRHIDFLEFHPRKPEGYAYFADAKGPAAIVHTILANPVPEFDVHLHRKLNDFIELINDERYNEPDITSFLERNGNLLKLGLAAFELNPQKLLEWQYSTELPNLKPDFMPTRIGGYADIVDFKLPRMKSKPIVGSTTRRQPSYEIDEAVSQLELYDRFCSQDLNREWLDKTYGIKVLNPTRIIVIGTSRYFPIADRQRLRATRQTTVITYDELIEMIRDQLYISHGG